MSSANGRVRISVSLAVLAVLLAGLALSKGDSARAVTTVLTVNSYLDTNDGDCSPSPAGCTLRDAMGLASDPFFLGAPVIKFDPSVFPSNFSGPLIDPGTPYPVLLGDSNVTIDGTGAGVDIDGSGMSPGGDAFSIQTVPGSDLSNVTVKNLLVENFLGGAAISLCAGVQGAFTCVADVTGGVDIDGLTALHDRFGIWVGAAALTGVTITNSTFTRDGPSDPIGIYTTREIANVSITNSTLTDDNDTPVRIDSLKSISGITLSNNNMTSTGFYVRANQGISNVTVQGNEIHDSSVEAGIRMDGRDGVSNVQVTGNTVANNTYYGVILIGESGPIEGVTIQDNTFTGNLSRGIQFSGDRGTAANSIKNNTIHDNGEEGIWVSTYSGASAPSVKITRNSTYANGRLGIDLNGYPNDAPDGVTPNDPGDADTGPNDLLNFPVITGSTPQAVTGTACASC
jgi:CSLREA domain-containing protein